MFILLFVHVEYIYLSILLSLFEYTQNTIEHTLYIYYILMHVILYWYLYTWDGTKFDKTKILFTYLILTTTTEELFYSLFIVINPHYHDTTGKEQTLI